MRSSKSIVLLIILAMGTWNHVPAASAQEGTKIGMVLQVQGGVTLRRPGTESRHPQIADLVYAEDQIETSSPGQLIISFCPKGGRVVVTENSSVAIQETTIKKLRGKDPVWSAGAKCVIPRVAVGEHQIEHSGITAARSTPLITLYVGNKISTPRPVFTWEPVPNADDYKLTVTKASPSGNGTVWSWQHVGNAGEARLPDTTSGLQPGAYSWKLVARANGTEYEQTAKFEVKPDQNISLIQVKDLKDQASQLERAIALTNAEYYAEAAAIFRELRSANPGDPRFTNELIWLYRQAGLILTADDEIKKASN